MELGAFTDYWYVGNEPLIIVEADLRALKMSLCHRNILTDQLMRDIVIIVINTTQPI